MLDRKAISFCSPCSRQSHFAPTCHTISLCTINLRPIQHLPIWRPIAAAWFVLPSLRISAVPSFYSRFEIPELAELNSIAGFIVTTHELCFIYSISECLFCLPIGPVHRSTSCRRAWQAPGRADASGSRRKGRPERRQGRRFIFGASINQCD